MGNRPQPAQEPVQPIVAHGQGISSRDEHVADLRRVVQVVEDLFQPRQRRRNFTLADHPGPRAVAAIGRAEVEGQQEYPIGVAVDQPRHGTVAFFAQGVVGFALHLNELARRGHDGPTQRLIRIFRVDEGEIIRGHGKRKQVATPDDGVPFVPGEQQEPLGLGQGVDAVAQLPVPVVPLAIGDLGEEAASKGPGLRAAHPP